MYSLLDFFVKEHAFELFNVVGHPNDHFRGDLTNNFAGVSVCDRDNLPIDRLVD